MMKGKFGKKGAFGAIAKKAEGDKPSILAAARKGRRGGGKVEGDLSAKRLDRVTRGCKG